MARFPLISRIAGVAALLFALAGAGQAHADALLPSASPAPAMALLATLAVVTGLMLKRRQRRRA